MTLLRAIGRTMLSSYFVLSGIRAIRKPEEFVDDAQPLTDRLVPTAKRFAPDQLADYIPEDTALLVRINGAVQVVGGVALATGKGRRFGAGLLALSLVPTTLARHPFWAKSDAEERVHERQQFVKSIGLLGGVIIASRDTEGKPGLVWRANEGRELAVRRTRRAKKNAKKAAKKALNQSHRTETAAAAIGTGLAAVGDAFGEAVEEVVTEGRKARKQASKRTKEARQEASKRAVEAQKSARKAAKKNAKKLRKSADDVQKRALSAAEDAGKNVRKFSEDARSQLGEHIQLGQN